MPGRAVPARHTWERHASGGTAGVPEESGGNDVSSIRCERGDVDESVATETVHVWRPRLKLHPPTCSDETDPDRRHMIRRIVASNRAGHDQPHGCLAQHVEVSEGLRFETNPLRPVPGPDLRRTDEERVPAHRKGPALLRQLSVRRIANGLPRGAIP